MRLVLASILLAFSAPAHADTLTAFTFSGNFLQTPSYLTGTLIIDTTTGQTRGGILTTYYLGVLTTFDSTGGALLNDPVPGFTSISLGHLYVSGDSLDLVFPVSSFVGYTGGPLCGVYTDFNLCLGYETDVEQPFYIGFLAVGSATPVVTPEPSSVVLLGTGVLGMAEVMRRRVAFARG